MNKRLAVVLVGWMACLSAAARAEVIQVDVEVPPPALWQDARGYTHVEIRGYGNFASPGNPALPSRAVNVLLPQGHAVVSVQVHPSEEIELPDTHVVFPAQKPWPLSFQGPRPFTQPDPDAYTSALVDDVAAVQAGQRLRGFQIQPVLLRPVVYRPAAGSLSYHPALTVLVTTTARKVLKPGYRGFARDFDRVRTLVANPDMLSQYTPRTHATRNPDYRYVVITSQALSACSAPNNLQTLTDDKQSRGISTLIKTMEEIRTGYQGVDDADKVRSFIRDMHTTHATDFVLIAGDADLEVVGGETEPPVVPVRGLWGDIGYGSENNIPSDLYYAALDGDFNADGDSVYGEENDDPDLMAEVWVGRAAVDNCTEVANFVRKTRAYQNGGGDWLRNVWMVGEILFEYPDYFAKDDLQHVHNSSSEGGVSTKGFSESTFYLMRTMYDADLGKEGWGPAEILDVLNGYDPSGPAHLINHLGHSYTYYNMRMMTDQIISGMHNQTPFFEYTQGCYPGAFDNRADPQEGNQVFAQDSFAEHMTLNQSGAFAAVMNTRYGLGGYSNYFHRYFWDAAFGQGMSRLGAMHAYSREQMAGWVDDEGMRWVYYEVTLFGDPELSFHLAASTADPVIGLPANEPYFLVLEGGDNPSDQTITIQNHGGKTLNWSVTSDQSWLTASPVEGTAPTEITLSVDATGRAIGTHSANLIFEAPEATNSPQNLPVHLVVITVPAAVAPYNPASPTVNGILSAGEYAGASVLDMDLGNPGTSTATIMHDGTKLYLALEIAADPDGDDYDAMLVMFDNNNDDLWPVSAGQEGIYEVFPGGYNAFAPIYNPGPEMQYGDWVDDPPGVDSAFNSTGSPRVVEVSFDLSQSYLQVLQGESFGMFLFFYDFLSGQDHEVVANWPWAIESYDYCTYFGDVTVGTQVDNLIAVPKSLAFSGYLDGVPTEEKNMTVGGTTTNNLSFDLSVSDPWIQVSATSGTTPQIIKVHADPAGLTTGTKTGWIEITSTGAHNSPYTVPVTFDVVPPPPIFSLDPEFLSFEANQQGTLPAGQSIQIANVGGGVLQWTAVAEGTWFDLDAGAGTAPSALTLTPNTTDLSPGFHAGAVLLTAPDAEPVQVELSYTIHIPPSLVVDPQSIERTDALAGGPVEVVLLVINEQLGPMNWSISENSPWITVEPESGTSIAAHPSRVTVTLDPAGMSAGLHSATLTVEAPEAANSPASVQVDWTLADMAVIAVEPESFTFKSYLGGPNPDAQALSITNPGPGALDWSVDCEGAYLSCRPDSGSAPGQVSVSVNTAGLGVGVYTTAITVRSPQGANSPVSVDVILQITAEPDNRPPPAPQLIAPADRSDFKYENPALVVKNVEDPDGDTVTYDFEVYLLGESTPITTIEDVAEGDQMTSVQVGELEVDQTYQWRARAVDDQGLEGDWSEMWIFTVTKRGGGCGCSSSDRGGFWLALLLFPLVAVCRSRRRTR